MMSNIAQAAPRTACKCGQTSLATTVPGHGANRCPIREAPPPPSDADLLARARQRLAAVRKLVESAGSCSSCSPVLLAIMVEAKEE